MRKGEIACNKRFLLFSQCFLPYMALTFHFKFEMSSTICFSLDQSKIRKVFVYKIQVNPIHVILYGDFYDFMDM